MKPAALLLAITAAIGTAPLLQALYIGHTKGTKMPLKHEDVSRAKRDAPWQLTIAVDSNDKARLLQALDEIKATITKGEYVEYRQMNTNRSGAAWVISQPDLDARQKAPKVEECEFDPLA